jgi:hypothetical protein
LSILDNIVTIFKGQGDGEFYIRRMGMDSRL